MSMVRKAAFMAGGAMLTVVTFADGASAQTTTTGGGISPSLYLIGGVLCGVACWFVAKSKGRSQVLWGILGFLFGVIPLIIIALLKRKQLEPTYGLGNGSVTPPLPPPPPMP